MKKILVVEDNDKNMYMMAFILAKSGYQVIKAETGELGVELALKEMPDLVLMDIQLPGIDGIEATKKIRASKADGKIPIVAITSYAMTGDKERVMAAGFTGYIEKPINPDTFMAEVERFIK